jgi:hypothetical protein
MERCIWKDKIKIYFEGVDRSCVSQDMDKWWTFVNTRIKLGNLTN